MNAQPDLRLLSTFLAVVAHQSMSGAARALGYVPSAVSQQISALEKSLGTALFTRHPGRPLALTPSGRLLADGAAQLFGATADFQDVAQRISTNEITQIRIGAYGTAACHLLPDVLARIPARNAGAGVLLQELETPVGLPMVRSGEVDVLVAHRYLPGDPPTEDSEVQITSIGHEPMLLMSAADPSRSNPSRLTDYSNRRWVVGPYPNGDRRALLHWAQMVGFMPQVQFETPDCHTAMAWISYGYAIGFIPASVAYAWPMPSDRRLEVVELGDGPQVSREVLVVTRRQYRPPMLNDLIDLLRTRLTEVCRPNR